MMTSIAIVGYGNIGRGVYKAIKTNPEIHLEGIISRNPERVRKEVGDNLRIYQQQDILSGNYTLNADVAILCGGSKKDLPRQGPEFAKLYNTVDSFDTHHDIPQYFRAVDVAARCFENTSIVCAGWDPGTFSVNRVLAEAFMPGCVPKAFYGLEAEGGLSMGHSDAVRQVDGVKDARQYTHTIPEAMERVRRGENPKLLPEQMHWRQVYVVAKKGANKSKIDKEIRNMPGYYKNHRVTVDFVTQEELDQRFSDMPHDGIVLAVGKTGNGNKGVIEYKNQWASNPEATANILVACARAAHKLSSRGQHGAFTMLDLSPADLSSHSRAELLEKFM